MSRVVEVLQAIARQESERRTFCELGVVTSSFDGGSGADSHSVSVTLKDSGLAINRIPLVSLVSGMAAVPRPGDVVLVLAPRGDLSSAVAFGQIYSDERRPPDFRAHEAVLIWPGDADDPATDAVDVRVSADGSARSLCVSLGGDKDARFCIRDGEIELMAGGVQVRLSHSSASDGTIEVAAGGTTIELSQDGDLKIESAGALTLKAASIKIEGDTQVSINGQTVGIN